MNLQQIKHDTTTIMTRYLMARYQKLMAHIPSLKTDRDTRFHHHYKSLDIDFAIYPLSHMAYFHIYPNFSKNIVAIGFQFTHGQHEEPLEECTTALNEIEAAIQAITNPETHTPLLAGITWLIPLMEFLSTGSYTPTHTEPEPNIAGA
jgi:hypothetical protein